MNSKQYPFISVFSDVDTVGDKPFYESINGYCVLRSLPDKNAVMSGHGADLHRTLCGGHRTAQEGQYRLRCNRSWPAKALRQLAITIFVVTTLPSGLS